MIRDENTGQSEKPVLVARKNLRLARRSGEPRGQLHFARGPGAQDGGRPVPVGSPVCPAAAGFCSQRLSAFHRPAPGGDPSAKSSDLAGSRRQKNQSLADFTSADIPRFWLLYTVNAAMPVFRHLFETRKGHPEALYSAMLSLAGSLSTFSLKVHPRDLPPYDHDDLGACFTNLDEKLRLLLDTVVPSN